VRKPSCPMKRFRNGQNWLVFERDWSWDHRNGWSLHRNCWWKYRNRGILVASSISRQAVRFIVRGISEAMSSLKTTVLRIVHDMSLVDRSKVIKAQLTVIKKLTRPRILDQQSADAPCISLEKALPDPFDFQLITLPSSRMSFHQLQCLCTRVMIAIQSSMLPGKSFCLF
jgi:hypothetical protein